MNWTGHIAVAAKTFFAIRVRSAALALVISTLPSLAVASPLYMRFDTTQAAEVLTIHYNLAGHPAFNGSAYVGQYRATISTAPDFSNGNSINVFCVDLDHDVNFGQQYPVQLASTNSLVNGGRIAYLYNTYGSTPITDSDYAAALQLAIWDELANNGQGQSLTSALQYDIPNQNVANYLATFLAAANSHSSTATWLQSLPNVSGYTQGQGMIGGHFGTPVPEPSTVALAGCGMLCLVFGRRYYRRQSAAAAG